MIAHHRRDDYKVCIAHFTLTSEASNCFCGIIGLIIIFMVLCGHVACTFYVNCTLLPDKRNVPFPIGRVLICVM